MSGLYNQLYLGINALAAQRAGIANAGHNIANVNTTGHTRTTVDLSAEEPDIGGVRATGTRGSPDELLARRERINESNRARADDLQRTFASLETQVAGSDQGVVDSIADFFGGFLQLASSPSDGGLRSSALQNASDLANAFAEAAAATRAAVAEANDRILTYADEATELARRIAETNRELRATTHPAAHDQRNQAARELSELTGGSARIDPDGQMRFVLDDGTALVHGDRAGIVTATSDAALGGNLRLDVISGNNVRDVTSSISSGRIGAQLSVRDQAGPQILGELDQLAFDLVREVNTVHQAHAGLDGVTGRALFAPLAGVAGAAENLAVDAALLGNPDAVAAADPTLGPSDNTGILQLLDLNDRTLAAGGQRTFVKESTEILSRIGLQSLQAQSDFELADLQSENLADLRDSLSGVSIEDELAHLSEFQRASEATTRFIATVDELLATMIREL